MNGLRYRRGNVLRFQSSQRSVENRLRAAELAKQFSGQTRAQARRERERQPSQVLVGAHSCLIVRGRAYAAWPRIVKYGNTDICNRCLFPAVVADRIARWRRRGMRQMKACRILLKGIDFVKRIEEFRSTVLVRGRHIHGPRVLTDV